jgi:hypothetical protein
MSIFFMSPSSIHSDRLAGHKRGLVGSEKSDHRRDLVGAAEATDRDRLGALGKADFEIVAILTPIGADRPRGADRPGADGVDGDPVGRQVEGERFGEPTIAAFEAA